MRKEISLIGIIVTILLLLALSSTFDLESLKAWVATSGPWAPIAFIIAKTLTIVLAPLSGGPLYLTAGLLFGFWPALAYLAVGDLLGYSAAFWISRTFGRKAVMRLLENEERPLLSKIVERVGTVKGFLYTVILFFPVPELVAYAAGLTRLPYLIFIMIIWPFWIIATSVLVFLGAHLNAIT